MALIGPNDLKQYALPSYWDASKLTTERLADGTTYEELLSTISAGLAAQNGALMSNSLFASLMSAIDEGAVEYGIGASNGFEAHTEYGRPDARRAATTGHMLPLLSYDRAFGWTWDFLQKARRIQIDEDIASGMEDLRNKFAQLLLTRHFKSTYDSVGSGRSMPFADGGTADAAYIPKHQPDRASAFDASHTHLQRLNGITQANLETAIAHLWEHGHDAPYDLLAAQADVSSWTNQTNVTGYVPRANGLIQYGTGQDLALVDPDVQGVIETDYGPVRVRFNARIPTKYWTVWKSYGPMDQRNPLRVRFNPRYGVGAILLAGDHIRQYPLENAILYMEVGVGIGDRTNGVIVENDSGGSYATPTIS